MTVLITLTTAGSDSGPFNLYSNLDGYVSAFATGVSKASLLAGYSSSAVPDYTTTVRVMSVGDCTNYIDISLSSPTTTTTTTTLISSCYTVDGIWEVDDPSHPGGGTIEYIDEFGATQIIGYIWLGSPFNIQALSITSTSGVTTSACLIGCYSIEFDATSECSGDPGHATIEFTDCDGIDQTGYSIAIAGVQTICVLLGPTNLQPAFICGIGTITIGSACTTSTTTTLPL